MSKYKTTLTPEEEELRELLNSYRDKLNSLLRSWSAIAAVVNLSRQACEASYKLDFDLDRDSIILIGGLSLEMSIEDLNHYLNFNGYAGLRDYIPRDLIIIKAISQKEYDYDSLNEKLMLAGEKPFSNHKRRIT